MILWSTKEKKKKKKQVEKLMQKGLLVSLIDVVKNRKKLCAIIINGSKAFNCENCVL